MQGRDDTPSSAGSNQDGGIGGIGGGIEPSSTTIPTEAGAAGNGPTPPVIAAQNENHIHPPPATANAAPPTAAKPTDNMAVDAPPELDDFGLPVRKYTAAERAGRTAALAAETEARAKASSSTIADATKSAQEAGHEQKLGPIKDASKDAESDGDDDFKDAVSAPQSDVVSQADSDESKDPLPTSPITTAKTNTKSNNATETTQDTKAQPKPETQEATQAPAANKDVTTEKATGPEKAPETRDEALILSASKALTAGHSRDTSLAGGGTADAAGLGISEFSHQPLAPHQPTKESEGNSGGGDDGWQVMPAYAPYDIYDDDNKLIAKEHTADEEEKYGYAGLGGAGKGYTRVLLEDDAESATSMDENTQYLFKDQGNAGTATGILEEEEETQRDAVSQLQATKELLTEGQRIAYVGLTRLELSAMLTDVENILHKSRKTKKQVNIAAESMKMWSQKMMIRLYSHMDISPAEQVMIEQLSAHGVVPRDLTPVLMANARVKNPMAEGDAEAEAEADRRSSTTSGGAKSPPPPPNYEHEPDLEPVAEPPPAYEVNDNTELTAPVRTPSQMPTTDKINIDLRWTVLCDLFLVLIADSIYDSRSRVLLERVGQDLEIPWIDICRFEKKVTDALEMQQNAEKENWNEDEHMENRRKQDLKRRYVLMGLATVGGGLVIGLSAGLLAPVIGAGLAAGFTTIGVTGTSSFLAGAGGAAIITSGAAASGSLIGGKAAERRTGSVKTFEYRPLHNNKRVNLIVTVSGWMTGKIDDVRLPYSTVDPVMGDIYSVLWEPEMLTSMGDTINILATEALTQGLQQLLGSTILVSLMAALQLPVVLTKLAYLIDNPWAVSLDRATMAGLILADSLIDRNLGTRPVTLVGYSLGSRVIFSCLQELARKGAFGIVQNVFLFGSPVVVKQDEYLRARTVVSGRFVNGYNGNDWILGYLFRLTNGGIRRVAGLAAIEGIEGLENMDVSEYVVGHMDYRTAMPRLLRECGWSVESDEFSEIEDPDPEKHQERQRELINEIEEARKELEREGKAASGKGGAFSFFRKKKALQKQEWEIYEDAHKASAAGGGGAGGNPDGGSGSGRTEDGQGNNHGVLFDVDAIRAELAKEGSKDGGATGIDEELLQVREIKSTLPPMKLDLSSSPSPQPPQQPALRAVRDSLRETKSANTVPQWPPNDSYTPQSSSHIRQSSREYGSVSSERTPTFPSTRAENRDYYQKQQQHSYYTSGGGLDDDEIQMTFDTGGFGPSDTGSSPPPKQSSYHTNADDFSFGGDSGISNSRRVSSTIPAADPAPPPTRPDLKSAQTVPNITLSDPWADYDDDEDFGKEKEISMTFA